MYAFGVFFFTPLTTAEEEGGACWPGRDEGENRDYRAVAADLSQAYAAGIQRTTVQVLQFFYTLVCVLVVASFQE
jgi:hypothetical protein